MTQRKFALGSRLHWFARRMMAFISNLFFGESVTVKNSSDRRRDSAVAMPKAVQLAVLRLYGSTVCCELQLAKQRKTSWKSLQAELADDEFRIWSDWDFQHPSMEEIKEGVEQMRERRVKNWDNLQKQQERLLYSGTPMIALSLEPGENPYFYAKCTCGKCESGWFARGWKCYGH